MRAEWRMNYAGFKKTTTTKKTGKHKSKDMEKAQESPGPHWVRPGGVVGDGADREVYTANGLYYR